MDESRPSHVSEGGSIASRSKLLSNAIELRSKLLRRLSIPGSSSTASQSNGILRMNLLTSTSRICSSLRIEAVALLPVFQDEPSSLSKEPLWSKDSPTRSLKIEAWWLPPPLYAPRNVPLCSRKRFHKVVLEP